MRKIFMVGASAAASVLLMTGCNKQVIDLTYEYSQAQIKMPDGTVIEGKVDSWNDYEGDQLQVKINGTTYLAHSSNVVPTLSVPPRSAAETTSFTSRPTIRLFPSFSQQTPFTRLRLSSERSRTFSCLAPAKRGFR